MMTNPVSPPAFESTAVTRPPDDPFAASLRGFGPVGIAAMLVILLAGNLPLGGMPAIPAGALLVLAWVRGSRTPWAAIGYVRPRSWISTIVRGVVLGGAFKITLKMIVMPLLGADPVNHAYHFLAGNRAMLPAAVWAMLVAGFGEETVFRGFLFERLGKWFGQSRAAKTAIVLITAAGFGLAHYQSQGLTGVEQAAIVGLVFGAVFAATGRIALLMIAHAAFDLTALALIYWNLETAVARAIFK